MNTRALLWLNFFLADIRDGLGPYVAIYLVTTHGWDPQQVGVTLTVMSVTTLIAQTPLGGLIDATRFKRIAVSIGAFCIGISSLLVMLVPSFSVVVFSKVLMGLAAALFPPAIAGITLGMMGRKFFTRQVGRNEAANHAGNVASAILAGGLSYLIAPVAIFYMGMASSVLSIISALMIKKSSINHDLARGLDTHDASKISSWKTLLESKNLLWFTLCIFLFHFANAAMLPLMGEKLSISHKKEEGILFMSSLILVAQLVMVPTAYLVGQKADKWGRKPLFLVGFAVLPIRGLLFAFVKSTPILVITQALDGVAAGIFGALFLIVIADLTKGTGRYNLSQGAASTLMGIGVALSTLITGSLVVHFSFSVAFIFLSAIALLAFFLYLFCMPETLHTESN